MRLLLLTNMYPNAHSVGDGVFIRRQVEALQRERDSMEVQVCLFDTMRGKWRYALGWLRSAWLVWYWKPDIVHVHYGLTQFCWPPWLSWLKPSVVTFHGSDLTIKWQRWLSICLLSRRSRVVCVSASLSPYVDGLSSLGSRVIPCGVAANRFAGASPAAARARLNLRGDERLVLFGASPLRPVKDYPLFKQAMDDPSSVPCRTATLADVPMDEVPSLIAAADVLVLTSQREGSPVVTKEALCAGTRVVSVDVGDVRQQLEGFSGAKVVACREPAAIADAIRLVLQDPSPDKQLAAARFDHVHEARALLALYDELCPSKGQR